MPVAEVLTRISHREFKLWEEWFFYDYNRSSKLDEYLAQLTFILWCKDRTDTNKITADSFKVKIVKSTPSNKTAIDIFNEGLKASKGIWGAVLGVGRKKSKGENVKFSGQPSRPSSW